MKHLSDYLLTKWGTSNIFDIDCSDEEYSQLLGWTLALEEYEINRQALSIVKAFSKEK